MHRIVIILFVFFLILTGIATLASPDNNPGLAFPAITVILLGISIVQFLYRRLQPKHIKPPPSQVAEIERLYFRAMREMLNENINYAQVISDFQRILSIDPNYKNTKHYMNRVVALQEEAGNDANVSITPNKADFLKLQEKLISEDSTVRKAVVMELIPFGPRAVDPLIALLMDEDIDVRVHAATALGWVGGPDAVQPLLVALTDKDLAVRRYAARAMCWVVDETAVEGLIEALSDEDTYVRSYSARALGWSQDPRAIGPLLRLLNDDSGEVRNYARTALEDLGVEDFENVQNLQVATS